MDYINEINLALKEFTKGNKLDAYKKLSTIFKNNKDDDKLRYNLAVVAQSLNLNEEAKDNYKYLIDKNNNVKSIINLYLIYIKESNYLYALEIINKLHDIDNNISVLRDKAYVLYKLKNYKESINICKTQIINKIDLNFYNILGLNYFAMNEFEEAEIIFKKALSFDSNNAFILNSLGRLYHEKRDSKNAEKYLVKANNLNIGSYEIINNLAGFYREEGDYNKAIKYYHKALGIDPQNTTIINNLAKAYFDINKLKIAEEYCLKALKLNKNDGNIKKILSLIYLRKQNYSKGWEYFDGRIDLTDFLEKNSTLDNIRKKLSNKNKLDKKSKILVLREQGIGDEILYGTMYPDLLNSYDNVTIECDKRLKNIFSRSLSKYENSFVEFGKISKNNDLINKFDVAIYAGSLGKFFRNKFENFGNGCYLQADINLVKKFKILLNNFGANLNIGISWKSFKNRYAKEKSLKLEDFKNILATEGCNFINLQYGESEKEVNNYNKKYIKKIITLKDFDIFNDFDSLASVLKNLDLFISVSNSTAHLAGSLGVKTLLIRPENHAVFHYWNQPDNKTPWYDSITFIDKDQFLNEKKFIQKYLDI